MRIHTADLGLDNYSFIRETFVEPAQKLTPEKYQGRCKAYHVTVTHPFVDHVPSCLKGQERQFIGAKER